MRRLILLLHTILLFPFVLSSIGTDPNVLRNFSRKADLDKWVDSVFTSLTPAERVGQLFMPIVELSKTESAKRRFNLLLDESKVGGFLFHKGTAARQAELTNLAQSRSKVPLLIALDGEWGLSMRLEETTRFPRNIALGAINKDSLLYLYGKEVARQCKVMGIHINFAPVLDVNSNPNNPIIGTRSFGEDVNRVIQSGIAYSKGLEDGGVLSVAKHFPGHGDTFDDSHKTLPSVLHSRERLNQIELLPFNEYIKSGLGGVLTAHLFVPSLEEKQIASSLSPLVVTDLLQTEMGFNGLIFTDALAMKGANTTGSVALEALKAGNDVLLGTSWVKPEIDSILKAAENGEISWDIINEKCKKILAYKYILGASRPKKIDTKGLSARLNTRHANQLNEKLTASSLTLFENKNGAIPLTNLENYKMASLSIGPSLKGSTIFQKQLQQYNRVDPFWIQTPAKEQQITDLIRQLSTYNCVLIGIHSIRSLPWKLLRELSDKTKVVYTFFISPFNIPSELIQFTSQSSAALLAFEDTPLAQEKSAQALFGGIEISGTLPVDIGHWKVGVGFSTTKTRVGFASPDQVGLSESGLNRIDSVVQSAIKEKAFPGCQVLVAKDGWIVYNRSFGFFDYASTHRVEESDLYDLASLTKATATLPAVMWCFERKLITFEDKLSKYFPEFVGTNKANITIRELLFHESGLRHIGGVSNFLIDNESVEGRVYSAVRTAKHRIQLDQRLWANGNVKLRQEMVSPTRSIHFTLQAGDRFYVHNSIVDSIMKSVVESNINPSKRYLYTDINFILLKMIVEKVSSKPMDELVENEVYRRIGANNLLFHPLRYYSKTAIAPTENDEFIRRQMLIGYVHDEIAAFMGGVGGHAGLFGNALDVAKLSECYLNDGKYGGEQIFAPEVARLFTQSKSRKSRRGLGFDKPDPNPSIGSTSKYAPQSTFGHTGFTGTSFWIDPKNKLTYVFISNRVYPKRWNKKISSLDVRTKIHDIIYESLITP